MFHCQQLKESVLINNQTFLRVNCKFVNALKMVIQITLNSSKEHFSIGNVAKLRCDMGYVVNDQVRKRHQSLSCENNCNIKSSLATHIV